MKKYLPISCLCSIYIKTNIKEFALSIDSIISQNQIPSEIVIVVDGNIDNDLKKLIKFLNNNYHIFQFHYLKKNMGLGLALRYGLSKCNNNLIARFDSDDINLEDRLKIQYNFMKDNPSISILGGEVIEFSNNLFLCNQVTKLKKMKDRKDIIFKKYMFRNPLNHPSVLFKKEDILRVGSYRDIKLFEDYELWLRCIKGGLLIKNINKPLVAMKRTSFMANRVGIEYAILEFKFLKHILKQKLINKIYIPIFLIRIFIRLLPFKILNILKLLDKKRINYNYNLTEYINKIINQEDSIFKKQGIDLK